MSASPMSDSYERVVALLTEKFEVSPESLTPEATLGDLDLDSLAAVELFVVIQERFGVRMDERHASTDLTVREVIDLAGSDGPSA